MKTNSLSAWILAVRPYSLGNSVILVLIGSALAWTDHGFHWLPAVLCLAFALLMQCTANLVNDLWDFLKGADQPDRLGPDRAFAKGYVESTASFLTPVERENLPYGAQLLTYMQTVRFLADYLDGDNYYKIKHPEHNWQRSKAQFKLLQSIEAQEKAMNDYIAGL